MRRRWVRDVGHIEPDFFARTCAESDAGRRQPGSDPVTITMTSNAKVFNDKPDVVLDGGGKVTLSGGAACASCTRTPATRPRPDHDPMRHPGLVQLTVQNITVVDGNSSGQTYGRDDVNGGGAIYVRGCPASSCWRAAVSR